MNEKGNIIAVVFQPDGQIGRYLNATMHAYISKAFMELMGRDRYQVYARYKDHDRAR